MRIVRATTEGDDEPPDWPEFNGGQLLRDLLTWVVVCLMQFGPAVLLLSLVGWRLLAREPNPWFWLAFAVCSWLGSGLATVAFGAAAHIGRLRVFSLLGHLETFVAAGGESRRSTSLTSEPPCSLSGSLAH